MQERLFVVMLCCLLGAGGQTSGAETVTASAGHLDGT
jgi:hypothetical protein